MDWQEVVRRVGRSRTDFTLTTWTDEFIHCKVFRLTCNCCGAWAQQAITWEMIVDAYYPELIFADVIERLVRFMLGINTTGREYADRRTVAGSRDYPSQKEVSA